MTTADAPPAQSASRRLVGLVRKEALQIVRDPSSIAVAFVLPALLLLLFGYGVSLDAKHVSLGLVVESPSNATASFTTALIASPYFDPVVFTDRQSGERALRERRVQGLVVLRSDFARRLYSPRGAPIQVLVSGTDANTARIIEGYLDGAWRVWLAHRALDERRPTAQSVVAEPRVWFNPEVRSRNFLVPGLIAIIMTLIGALLTALVIAREWERGTMEALLVTPVRIGEIILGKLVPYFALGMGGMALSTAMGVWLFEVPLRGSFLVLSAVAAIFMVAMLGLGLLISTVARSQFVAGQVAILVGFLPAFILSGFLFDIASMPEAIQVITHVVPARYFVAALQSLFLAGDVWAVVVPNALALGLMAAIFLGLTRRRTRKSLE